MFILDDSLDDAMMIDDLSSKNDVQQHFHWRVVIDLGISLNDHWTAVRHYKPHLLLRSEEA